MTCPSGLGKMTSEEFSKLLSERLNKTRDTLSSKKGEYANDVDVLHNFKRAGEVERRTPAACLKSMWTKHLVSILDTIDENRKVTREWIDEKIGDSIAYLILLEGILLETSLATMKSTELPSGNSS